MSAAPPRDYYETWPQIGDALGRSVTWCHKMARRAKDPLPVFRVGGTVRMTVEGMKGWLERQEARRYGCEAGCDDVGAP